jgi:2-desacetyl-2-hydroxyethyl bacteriochlorophyllide A dehydrogenase
LKALTIVRPHELAFKDIPEPAASADEVIIDIRYIGLCGSDLNAYRGLMPLVEFPRIPGHEISGEIVDKGRAVPDAFFIGQKVMVSPYSNCGFCPACRLGRVNCCEYNQTLGVQRDGALTQRIAVHHSKVFAGAGLSFEELALVEPLSVGYHAANRGAVTEIDTVLVFGCGAIGMGAICACVRKGAKVVVVDVDDNKLAQAEKMGAQFAVNSRNLDLDRYIADLTNSEGVNVAIEAVGLPETFRKAVELVCFAGRVVFIGYTKTEVRFDSKLFVQKELDVRGSRNALHVFPSVIQMLGKRERPYESLITKVFPFNDAAGAFAFWDKHPEKVTKLLIDMKS